MIQSAIPSSPSLSYRCQVIAGLLYPPSVPIGCAMKGLAAMIYNETAPLKPCSQSQSTEPELEVPHELLHEGNGDKIRAHLIEQLQSIALQHPQYHDVLVRAQTITWTDAHLLGEFYGDLAPKEETQNVCPFR